MGQAQMISTAEHEALITSARVVLAAGQRILVVGCPPGTFADVAEAEGLVFWPSSAPSSHDGSRVVPLKVGVILVTDQLSHALSRNVREQARARNLICPATTFSAGGARRLLTEMLSEGAPVMPRPKVVTPFNPPVLKPLDIVDDRPNPAKAEAQEHVAAVLRPSPALATGRDVTAQLEDLQKLITDMARALTEAAAGLELLREGAATLAADVALVKRQAEKVKLLKELLT